MPRMKFGIVMPTRLPSTTKRRSAGRFGRLLRPTAAVTASRIAQAESSSVTGSAPAIAAPTGSCDV